MLTSLLRPQPSLAADTDTTTTTSTLISILVSGSPQCGKTTFIDAALALPLNLQPYDPSAFHHFRFLNRRYAVQLHECHALEQQALLKHESSGEFVLYDPTSPASLKLLAPALGTPAGNPLRHMHTIADIVRAEHNRIHNIPTALVATKWDCAPSHRRLGPTQIDQHRFLANPSLAFEHSARHPSVARQSLECLVKEIIAPSLAHERLEWLDEDFGLRGWRLRRHTATHRPAITTTTSSDPKHHRHLRTQSEFVRSPNARDSDDPTLPLPRREHGLRPSATKSPGTLPPPAAFPPAEHKAPLSLATSSMLHSDPSPAADSPARPRRPHGSHLVIDHAPPMPSTASALHDDLANLPVASAHPSYTFSELVDRLLSTSASDQDQTAFTHSFLALFRLFAAPCELLELLLRHFDLCKTLPPASPSGGVALHHLNVLQRWILEYPGDLAHDYVHRSLRSFLLRLHADNDLHDTAADLLLRLEGSCRETEDTGWGVTDESLEEAPIVVSLQSATAAKPASELPSGTFDYLTTVKAYSTEAHSRAASIFSQSTSTLGARAGSAFTSSSQDTIDSDSALREVMSFSAQATTAFTKAEWRLIMDTPDRSIAKELTRIDHSMFRLVRPRDLVRHATLSPEARERYPGTENVNRMIAHFNHLFLFCCNLVLFRDKPKHRAIALAKLMAVGRELRKLNNYNALGAIVAGLKSASISRLGQTWELVEESRRRDFERLGILMSTGRGNHAYRMAWENTFGERIPFMALHRRDLLLAAQNKTFVEAPFSEPVSSTTPTTGARPSVTASSAPRSSDAKTINWRKFEIMGETLNAVRHAQAQTTYADVFTANDQVRKIVLNSKIVQDEEHLYEWSTQLEAGSLSPAPSTGGSAGVENVKRRLAQLKKSYGLT